MGQGLYTMLGFGILNPPQTDDDDRNDDLTSALMDLGLHTAYETEPLYVVIPLAVDDEVLQDWWKLVELPDMLPHPRARTAHVLELAPETLAALAQAGQTDLVTMWCEAQRLYTEAGLILGEPGPIVLNDWD